MLLFRLTTLNLCFKNKHANAESFFVFVSTIVLTWLFIGSYQTNWYIRTLSAQPLQVFQGTKTQHIYGHSVYLLMHAETLAAIIIIWYLIFVKKLKKKCCFFTPLNYSSFLNVTQCVETNVQRFNSTSTPEQRLLKQWFSASTGNANRAVKIYSTGTFSCFTKQNSIF